jgi:hypothetical protein
VTKNVINRHCFGDDHHESDTESRADCHNVACGRAGRTSGPNLDRVERCILPGRPECAVTGRQVTFDVTLSGLDVAGNQQIGTLGATLSFDANLLGTPLSIGAGSIVPDTSAFLISPGAGVADASYSEAFSSTSASITTNGLFFQFTVVAQSDLGSGNISFSFVDAFDPNFNSLSISGGPELPFQVISQAVPEPGTLFLAASGAVLLALRQARRRLLRDRTTNSRA